MKNKAFLLILLVGFSIGLTNLIPTKNTANKTEFNNTIEPLSAAIDDTGIYIPNSQNSTAYCILGNTLFFTTSENGGQLFRMELNSSTMKANLMTSGIGTVNDMAAMKLNDEDYILIAKNNGLWVNMYINCTGSPTFTNYGTTNPVKRITVSAYELGGLVDLYLCWMESNSIFYTKDYNSGTPVFLNITPSNFQISGSYQKHIQFGKASFYPLLLMYDQDSSYIFDTQTNSTYRASFYTSNALRSAYLDTSRHALITALDDDNEMTLDGVVSAWDYEENRTLWSRDSADYPTAIWAGLNHAFWLEHTTWSLDAIIYRHSFTYDSAHPFGWESKVSKTQPYPELLQGWNSPSTELESKLFYWIPTAGIYQTNYRDLDAPSKPVLSSNRNELTQMSNWTLTWTIPTDLNVINGYEVWQSTSPDFNGFNYFYTTEISMMFKDKTEGQYYYRVKANDSSEPSRTNFSEWSNVIHINFTIVDDTSNTPNNPSIDGFNGTLVFIVSFAIVGIIVKKHRIIE